MSHGMGKDGKDITKGSIPAKQNSVATANSSSGRKHHPHNMHKIQPDELFRIIKAKAESVLRILAAKENNDAWFSLIQRLALQNEILYLADAMRAYMDSNPQLKYTWRRADWEDLRDITKHFALHIPEEVFFDFVKAFGPVVTQALADMTDARDPNKPAFDAKQLAPVIELTHFADSKSNSLYTIMQDLLASFKQEEPVLDEKDFHNRITQKIIPVINVLADLQSQAGNTAAVIHYDETMLMPALCELLKECGRLYAPEKAQYFKIADANLKKFLSITRYDICNRAGHETPDAVRKESIAKACKLAGIINSKRYVKPSDVDLSYSPNPVASANQQGDEKSKPIMASPAAFPAASPPGGVGFDQKFSVVSADVKVDNKKPKTLMELFDDIADVTGDVQHLTSEQQLTFNKRLIEQLHTEVKKNADGFNQIYFKQLHDSQKFVKFSLNKGKSQDVKEKYKRYISIEMRASIIRCIPRHEQTPSIRNFLNIVENLKKEFISINELIKKLKNTVKAKDSKNDLKDFVLLGDKLLNIDGYVAEFVALKEELARKDFKFNWPKEDHLTHMPITKPAILIHPDVSNITLFDANDDKNEIGILTYCKLDIPKKHPTTLQENIKIKNKNIYIIEDVNNFIENIIVAYISYADNLNNHWPASRKKLEEQVKARLAELQKLNVQALTAAAPAAAPSPILAVVADFKDDKKPESAADARIKKLLKQPSLAIKEFAVCCQNAAAFMLGFEDKEYEKNSANKKSLTKWIEAKKHSLNSGKLWPGFVKAMMERLDELKLTLLKPGDDLDKVQAKINLVKSLVADLVKNNPVPAIPAPSPTAVTTAAPAVDIYVGDAATVTAASISTSEQKNDAKLEFIPLSEKEINNLLLSLLEGKNQDLLEFINDFLDRLSECEGNKIKIKKWHALNDKKLECPENKYDSNFVKVMKNLSAQIRCNPLEIPLVKTKITLITNMLRVAASNKNGAPVVDEKSSLAFTTVASTVPSDDYEINEKKICIARVVANSTGDQIAKVRVLIENIIWDRFNMGELTNTLDNLKKILDENSVDENSVNNKSGIYCIYFMIAIQLMTYFKNTDELEILKGGLRSLLRLIDKVNDSKAMPVTYSMHTLPEKLKDTKNIQFVVQFPDSDFFAVMCNDSHNDSVIVNVYDKDMRQQKGGIVLNKIILGSSGLSVIGLANSKLAIHDSNKEIIKIFDLYDSKKGVLEAIATLPVIGLDIGMAVLGNECLIAKSSLGPVYIWNFAKENTPQEIPMHMECYMPTLLPNHKDLVVFGGADGSLAVLNTKNKKHVVSLPDEKNIIYPVNITALVYSKRHKCLVVAALYSNDESLLTLWDISQEGILTKRGNSYLLGNSVCSLIDLPSGYVASLEMVDVGEPGNTTYKLVIRDLEQRTPVAIQQLGDAKRLIWLGNGRIAAYFGSTFLEFDLPQERAADAYVVDAKSSASLTAIAPAGVSDSKTATAAAPATVGNKVVGLGEKLRQAVIEAKMSESEFRALAKQCDAAKVLDEPDKEFNKTAFYIAIEGIENDARLKMVEILLIYAPNLNFICGTDKKETPSQLLQKKVNARTPNSISCADFVNALTGVTFSPPSQTAATAVPIAGTTMALDAKSAALSTAKVIYGMIEKSQYKNVEVLINGALKTGTNINDLLDTPCNTNSIRTVGQLLISRKGNSEADILISKYIKASADKIIAQATAASTAAMAQRSVAATALINSKKPPLAQQLREAIPEAKISTNESCKI